MTLTLEYLHTEFIALSPGICIITLKFKIVNMDQIFLKMCSLRIVSKKYYSIDIIL